MSSLGFLIVEDNFSTNLILYVGNIGLTIASMVTIYTGYIYFKRKSEAVLMKKSLVLLDGVEAERQI